VGCGKPVEIALKRLELKHRNDFQKPRKILRKSQISANFFWQIAASWWGVTCRSGDDRVIKQQQPGWVVVGRVI
jgi:hypothetical protein